MANRYMKRCSTQLANYSRNATQNYEVPLQPVSMALKSLQTTNAREGVEKREPSYTVGRNIIGTTTMENYGSSSKTKNKAAI